MCIRDSRYPVITEISDCTLRMYLILNALKVVREMCIRDSNTIRLAIYSKRFLIHTMKLGGASWAFIRRPFLRRNFWIGVLAAFIADSLLWGAAYWLRCV